jgi:hypothetical protein
MTVDPAVELANLRRERRGVLRVLRVSGPVTAIGMVTLFIAGPHLANRALDMVALPTILGFFVTFTALARLGNIRGRDLVNRFRPGSARAYDDE